MNPLIKYLFLGVCLGLAFSMMIFSWAIGVIKTEMDKQYNECWNNTYTKAQINNTTVYLPLRR